MTWQFTVTHREILQRIQALQKTKGTRFHKTLFFTRIFLFAVLTVSFAIPLLRSGNVDIVACAILIIIYLLILLFILGLTGLLFPLNYLFLFSANGQLSSMLGNCSITVLNGMFIQEGAGMDGYAGSAQRSLAEAKQILPRKKGILILFSDDQSAFLPHKVLTKVPRERCLSFLLEEQKRAQQNPQSLSKSREKPDAPANHPEALADQPSVLANPLDQPEPEASGGTLYFTLPDSYIGPLYEHCCKALPCCPAYWKLQWKSLSFMGILFLFGLLLKSRILLLFPCLVFLLIGVQILILPRRFRRMGERGKLDAAMGPQRFSLLDQELMITRSKNTIAMPYSMFEGIYDAGDAFFLLQKKPLGFLPIPKWAFTTKEEELLFVSQLRSRIENANPTKRVRRS